MMASTLREPARITTAAKLAFLRRAASYPDAPHAVECIETHYAWVFVSRRFAYKLKKPVRTPWFDYTTASARHADARNEVTLNRRLARDVYLGVVPLTLTDDDSLRLEGSGETIDWLVKMRRLESQHMLDSALRERRATAARIDELAELLARFWVRQPAEPIAPDVYLAQLSGTIAENAAFLRRSVPSAQAPTTSVESMLEGYVRSHSAAFSQRIAAGTVKELHGDLRPEHVCLIRPPVVIDCLQFSRALRILDVVDELAFLALECEKLAGGWIEAPIRRRYQELSNDRAPQPLIDFYKAFRALLRAKLAAGHLGDCPMNRRSHWESVAADYLRSAYTYATRAMSGDR